MVAGNSEITFWSLQQPNALNIIRNNGMFGITGSFGSQVSLAGAHVTDNAGPAVDIYGHSQLYAASDLVGLIPNEISRNGNASDPNSAAIRVDGNSQVQLRGGSISQNTGPAILALVNSSADFTGVSFNGNTAASSHVTRAPRWQATCQDRRARRHRVWLASRRTDRSVDLRLRSSPQART
ncbi:MAG TPA: hypothetical protein VG498_13325 [Terriglobales bacterium]|nr:hypothetical protein [Terriglobales bacterium]